MTLTLIKNGSDVHKSFCRTMSLPSLWNTYFLSAMPTIKQQATPTTNLYVVKANKVIFCGGLTTPSNTSIHDGNDVLIDQVRLSQHYMYIVYNSECGLNILLFNYIVACALIYILLIDQLAQIGIERLLLTRPIVQLPQFQLQLLSYLVPYRHTHQSRHTLF